MTTLTPGVMFETRDNRVTVDNRLDPGVWNFSLTVVDNDGNESAPATLAVNIQPPAVAPMPTPTPFPRPRPLDPRLRERIDTIATAHLDPRVVVTPAPGPVVNPALNPRVIIRRPG